MTILMSSLVSYDQYDAALDLDEDRQRAYWECVEEDLPEDEDLDAPLSDNAKQWIFDNF